MCSSGGGGGGRGGGRRFLRSVVLVRKGGYQGRHVEFMKNLIYHTCKHLALPARLFPSVCVFGMRIMYLLFLRLNSKQNTCFRYQ